MNSDIPSGVKRKCNSLAQTKGWKRQRQEAGVNMLDLSDCALLHILKYLDVSSLYQLGRTCVRLDQLVQDESLWVHVDSRKPPNHLNKAEFCWRNINKRTRSVQMAATGRSKVVLCLDALLSDKLTNLTVLALEHQCIKYCKLSEFPKSLQELSFRHSFIPHHSEFFRFAQNRMVNLKTLILDHCQWLEASSLISLCRYPKLEILSLYMCKKLDDSDISDVSLAGKFGFQNMKVFDLRFTGLGEQIIKTFYKNPSLQVIYFQRFASTYYLERIQRKLDLLNGATPLKSSYISDDETSNDTSRRSFKKRFNAKVVIPAITHPISDETMVVFRSLKSNNQSVPRPQSYLYTYPYGDCNCEFQERKSKVFDTTNTTEAKKQKGSGSSRKGSHKDQDSDDSSSEDEDHDISVDWNIQRLLHKLSREIKRQKMWPWPKEVLFMHPENSRVCRQLKYDSCTLPEWCQEQAQPGNPLHEWLYVREPRNDFEISMLEHTDKHFKFRNPPRYCKLYWDCDCKYSFEDDLNIIVINRDRLDQPFQIGLGPKPQTAEAQCNDFTSAEVGELVKKMSVILTKFKQEPTRGFLSVKSIVEALSELVEVPDLANAHEDSEFACELEELLQELVRIIRQDMDQVLLYHTNCFHELLKQLLRRKIVSKQKYTIRLFFMNLLCSEGDRDHSRIPLNGPVLGRETPSFRGRRGSQPGPSRMQYPPAPYENRFFSSLEPQGIKEPPKKNIVVDDDSMEILIEPLRMNAVPSRIYQVMQSQYDRLEVLQPIPPVRIVQRQFRNDIMVMELPRGIPTNIKELSLRGYHVTDKTLNTLKELELDLLDVTGTAVTLTGLRNFMQSNPHCRLVHEFACKCRPRLHF